MYPGNGGVFNKATVQSIALLLNTGLLDIIARAIIRHYCKGTGAAYELSCSS